MLKLHCLATPSTQTAWLDPEVYTALLDVDAVSRLRIHALAHDDHNHDRTVDLDDARMMRWLLLTLRA